MAYLDSDVLMRLRDMQQVYLGTQEEAILYDEVNQFRQTRGNDTIQIAWNFFENRHSHIDAIIKVVYNFDHPDWVFKYNAVKKVNDLDLLCQNLSYTHARRLFEQNLLQAGFTIIHEPAGDDEHVYVKIYTPFELLASQAESIDLQMRLKVVQHQENITIAENQRQSSNALNIIHRWRSIEKLVHGTISANDTATPFRRNIISKFEYGDTSLNEIQQKFFPSAKRILLTYYILQTLKLGGTSEYRQKGLRWLIEHSLYQDSYPLHDGSYKSKQNQPNLRTTLAKEWTAKWYRRQPLDDVRYYFGDLIIDYIMVLV